MSGTPLLTLCQAVADNADSATIHWKHLEDSIQLVGELLEVGQTLCHQTPGVGKRLCQEVRRVSQGRAGLELAHQPSSARPFPVCARFALQVGHRVYGTLDVASDPAHPASPALPLPEAELLARTCAWLLYTLDLSAFMQGQCQRLDHQLSEELTRREREVLTLLCRGYSQQLIATMLHLAPATVQTYCKRLCQKLAVHCERDLPLAAYQAHLFPIPQ